MVCPLAEDGVESGVVELTLLVIMKGVAEHIHKRVAGARDMDSMQCDLMPETSVPGVYQPGPG